MKDKKRCSAPKGSEPALESFDNPKTAEIDRARVKHDDNKLTTNMGLGIRNDQESLKAGKRGPVLLEDFVLREKITHFDHERIPERVVHARGFGAHGYFEVYKDMSDITMASFLRDPKEKTPVFVRFSTVAGFRGSADTVRDVRGFATKFYTKEGNYDLVANNMPVFFIQDAIKFPDLIHALKPEPNNEIPQAQSAHDTFWDFIGNNPETAHNMILLMSDRAIPESYRTMDGFGIHTFKFVNAKGEFKFVKFHWKSLQGVHSLVWDEAQKIAGEDPDFNRRDLFINIENGNYPSWELGIQVLDPKDEFKFDFDILDATKLWPEEIIPVQRIGKMTLNRNVTNYFAETEQVAFCPANLVAGIDLSDDPLLQGRLFSYLDTQISRLGGPNFHEIPINKPIAPINNNQRDGMHRMSIDEGVSAYYRNAIADGEPHPASNSESQFNHMPASVNGYVTRDRAERFMDFFSQPAMFWNSMSSVEKKHIILALAFELGKCKSVNVRQKAVDLLNHIDGELSSAVALRCGATPPAKLKPVASKASSPALSMLCQPNCPKGRKVAVLISDGFNKECFDSVCNALIGVGANVEVVADRQGTITSSSGVGVTAAETFATTSSVLYNAVFVPDNAGIATLLGCGYALGFVNDAYKHLKPVMLVGGSKKILEKCGITAVDALECGNNGYIESKGLLVSCNSIPSKECVDRMVYLVGAGRHWEREADVAGVIS